MTIVFSLVCWPENLAMFGSFNKEQLDLHELFEAGGNDMLPVLDTVERMVKDGLLEERRNDFYTLTPAGRVKVPVIYKD